MGTTIVTTYTTKNLTRALTSTKLLLSDNDVLQMVQHHACHYVIVLYLLDFEDDENEKALNDDGGRQRVDRNDFFWSKLLSSDDDAFEVDEEEEVEVDNDVESDEEGGDGLHGVEIDVGGGGGVDRSDVGNGSHMVVYNVSNVDDTSNAGTSRSKKDHSFSSLADDDKSYNYSSDLLESPLWL
jgi:hypothetical protein